VQISADCLTVKIKNPVNVSIAKMSKKEGDKKHSRTLVVIDSVSKEVFVHLFKRWTNRKRMRVRGNKKEDSRFTRMIGQVEAITPLKFKWTA